MNKINIGIGIFNIVLSLSVIIKADDINELMFGLFALMIGILNLLIGF